MRVTPVRRNPVLDAYEGEWVAVKHGTVLAHSPSSSGLVPLVRALGPDGDGAVIEFVQPPTDAWVCW